MDDATAISTAQARQLSILWTKAYPIVSTYFRALLCDFHQAEDLLQETAAAAAEKFTTYDPSRSFTAWVLGVARSRVARLHRTTTGGALQRPAFLGHDRCATTRNY